MVVTGGQLFLILTRLYTAKKVFGWGGNTWKLWATCSKCGCCNSA